MHASDFGIYLTCALGFDKFTATRPYNSIDPKNAKSEKKHTSPVLVAAVDPFDAEAALHQLFPQQNTE